jgi:hypothetical protein
MVFDKLRRYPVKMHIYIQRTGRLLVHRISQILTAQGFKTWINPKQRNGIDLKVWKDGKLILVAEVFNWSSYTYCSAKRKNRITNNLIEVTDCKRVLIYTAMRDETAIDDLDLHDISTLKIGYQILPKDFYKHYEAKNQIENRRIDSKETSQHIKAKLTELMQSLNIEIGIMPVEGQEIRTAR